MRGEHGSVLKPAARLVCVLLCVVAAVPAARAQQSRPDPPVAFRLPDSYGRVVDGEDYAGVPLLVMSGSCWCGGCQQDAEPLRRIAAEYGPKGLMTLRTVAGDNELRALDFQKHYRLPFVQLMDTNRAFEKRHNRDGWTFLMLADRQGRVVYKVNSPRDEDWRELRALLDKMLSPRTPIETVTRDGVIYMPQTTERSGETDQAHVSERFPSIACGKDGRVYVVFTTNRSGSLDVYLRFHDGQKWSDDIPVAAGRGDEYDGTIMVDPGGKVWICWTGDTGGKYDVFVTSFAPSSGVSGPQRLTYSDDDAMHARMAFDSKGRIWVTYYKWRRMREYSRDSEVYVRVLDGNKWSDEVQVTPTDVPDYEDHVDPAITAYGDNVVVAWSWDFHPPNEAYSDQAEMPTIFIRVISYDKGLGEILCFSGKRIDSTPTVAACDGERLWCAWDNISSRQLKGVCISSAYPGCDSPVNRTETFSAGSRNVCTPSFTAGGDNRLTLLWSATQDGTRWTLKRADLNADGSTWLERGAIEAEGNPRFCSAAYDPQGRLWLAYSVETEDGKRIAVKTLDGTPEGPVVSAARGGDPVLDGAVEYLK